MSRRRVLLVTTLVLAGTTACESERKRVDAGSRASSPTGAAHRYDMPSLVAPIRFWVRTGAYRHPSREFG